MQQMSIFDIIDAPVSSDVRIAKRKMNELVRKGVEALTPAQLEVWDFIVTRYEIACRKNGVRPNGQLGLTCSEALYEVTTAPDLNELRAEYLPQKHTLETHQSYGVYTAPKKEKEKEAPKPKAKPQPKSRPIPREIYGRTIQIHA